MISFNGFFYFKTFIGEKKIGIFKLNKEVSETTEDIDPDDVVNIKTNLKDLGYYQTPDYGMTKFGDTQMFEGLRKMQKEKGLSVDGVAKPQGETEGMFNQLLKVIKKHQ